MANLFHCGNESLKKHHIYSGTVSNIDSSSQTINLSGIGFTPRYCSGGVRSFYCRKGTNNQRYFSCSLNGTSLIISVDREIGSSFYYDYVVWD